MANVSVTKSINVSANDAWSKLSSFRGIEHFSPIERSVTVGEGQGATRSCYMPDGAEIKEVLSQVNNVQMNFEYKILSGPFPITNYVSNVEVKSLDNENCSVSWSCTYDVDPEGEVQMNTVFDGFYHTMIDGLETLINTPEKVS
jgi:hypothetical protein